MPRVLNKPVDAPVRPKLTLKQKRFVQHYVETGNGAEAVIRAGYGVKNREQARKMAYDNKTNPDVKLSLEEELDRAGLSQNKMLGWLHDAIQSGVGRDSRNSDALRGIDYLAKMYGMYPDKKVSVEKRSIVLKLGQKDTRDIIKSMLEQKQKMDVIVESNRDVVNEPNNDIHPIDAVPTTDNDDINNDPKPL